MVDYGRPATFKCSYRGNPVETVRWMKDGEDLGLAGRDVLRINSVKKEDRGMYQCFVRNDRESAQATGELKLGGRFDPPEFIYTFADQTVQPGETEIRVCCFCCCSGYSASVALAAAAAAPLAIVVVAALAIVVAALVIVAAAALVTPAAVMY